jgi:hypothetical protein
VRGRGCIVELWLPWAGLAGAGLAWALSHQIGSIGSFDDCTAGSPLLVGLVGLTALALAGLSGLASWRVWRRGREESAVRRFLGLLCALFAALLALAIALQTTASFIVPRCFA